MTGTKKNVQISEENGLDHPLEFYHFNKFLSAFFY